MKDLKLTVVILTYNEELHIERAIRSISSISETCYVVDSGSSDKTIFLAKKAGAKILTHAFVNQAEQFNWALEQLPSDTVWVFRLDADEVLSPELEQSLCERLPTLGTEVAGGTVLRRIAFLGEPIRWGGLFPFPVLRLLRFRHGRSENRWMDEHIVVDGETIQLDGEILDNNLKSLSWWIDKHNNYASREAVELLNVEFDFLKRGHAAFELSSKSNFRRWLKTNIYGALPTGFRAFAYFLYRYFFRFGFLDGKKGRAFHFLQGFWYRYLVDLKVEEVKHYMNANGTDAAAAIRDVLKIDVQPKL